VRWVAVGVANESFAAFAAFVEVVGVGGERMKGSFTASGAVNGSFTACGGMNGSFTALPRCH
jgi:hypothetical protein